MVRDELFAAEDEVVVVKEVMLVNVRELWSPDVIGAGTTVTDAVSDD